MSFVPWPFRKQGRKGRSGKLWDRGRNPSRVEGYRVLPAIWLLSCKISYKIWGVLYSDYEECRLLGYKTPVCTSQETHYFSVTETNRLMLCKIWSFHGGEYEECRLLGYKNPVCTSQETHYFSVTELGQLMLCKIWGFDGWLWRMSSSVI
jgi:hypothetical protein